MNVDLNKDYGFSTSVTDFPGTDFRTDWNTIGDYSGLSGQPFSSKSSNDPVWSTAKSLANMWNKNKYRTKAEESNSFGGFAQNRNTSEGGLLQPLGKDNLVWVPPQKPPITVAGGQSSGGLGSTIGGLVGIGGQALGVFGPLGYAAGTLAGKAADEFRLFG
jgi:hypothetical protein